MKTDYKKYTINIADELGKRRRYARPLYTTQLGEMYCGLSEKLLTHKLFQEKYKGKVQLIFTSPPFPLNAKKKYGNLTGKKYIKWLASFAQLFTDYVTDEGSIVIEIGNAWEPGKPVMSTVVIKSLLKFLEKGDLNLCQEFVWYNPAKLPSPVQWVNVERIRVKDSFTKIWWMSKTENPKADNRRVLKEYSNSMKKLIKSQKYNAGKRPSAHSIGEKSFLKNNNGAIPPNVIDADYVETLTNILKGSNTGSIDSYQMYCRENSFPAHPARMPSPLVEFFIKFLTDENDIILDPFAGSNTTGYTAESLNRKWVSIEASWDYAPHSLSRFPIESIISTGKEITLENKNK
jgi:site-specific DNA-methyltransferase (cytosine-N4-specific)